MSIFVEICENHDFDFGYEIFSDKNYRFWSKFSKNRDFLSKKIDKVFRRYFRKIPILVQFMEKFRFGRNLQKIRKSILVKFCENLDFGRNVVENLDFGRNLRKSRFWSKLKSRFGRNLRKSRFWSKFAKI